MTDFIFTIIYMRTEKMGAYLGDCKTITFWTGNTLGPHRRICGVERFPTTRDHVYEIDEPNNTVFAEYVIR